MSFFRTVALNNDVLDFIVHTSQFVDEDLLQRKGQHFKECGVSGSNAAADILCITPDNDRPQATGAGFVKNGDILRNISNDLHFVGSALHIRKALFQQHFAVIQDAHMVTDILQLPQIVRGDQYRSATLRHVGHDYAPYLTAHHRVQTIHRLIQNQHVGTGADGQMEGCLLLHTLGETTNLHGSRETEYVMQFGVQRLVEIGVYSFVILMHILQCGGGEVEYVIGNVTDAGFDSGVFENGLPVDENLACILSVDTGEMANDGGFSCAVPQPVVSTNKGGEDMKTAEGIIAYLEAELNEAIELHDAAKGKDPAQAHATLLKAYTISELLDVIKG